MITSLLTFVSTRLVSVIVTTVVVVVTVPVLVIVAIHGHTVTISTSPVASESRKHEDAEKTRIVIEVKNAGNTVIVKLDNEEASCNSQIAALASQSKLSATATAAALKKGHDNFNTSVAIYVNEIKADEDELEHLTVVTTQTEQEFLIRIREIQVIALGDGSHTATLITVCQTILVEIQQVIVVVQPAPGAEGDDGD
ncbi:MAG: hypothetical protein E6I53_14850 [Chloroflexi bacterium]|nr:MAG: hypothetical protein E6I53_14850 [Chloroflexota bacterium]